MDCLEAMRGMADNAFDLAIVDPPYGVNIAKWDKTIPTDEYFTALFRVSKNQIIFGGNFFTLPPTRCYIVWNKKQWLKVRSTLEYAWTSFARNPFYLEYTYCGNAEGLKHITVDYTKKSIHPCQKPSNLYSLILQEFSILGDTILDTHLGSGSSRIAAYDLGFDFTGFELDKDYYEAQEKRFANHLKQPTLFETLKPQPAQEVLFAEQE